MRRVCRRIILLAGISSLATPAFADDLRGALWQTYQTNPILQGARAQQRALDETVPLEKADGRPFASASAAHTEILRSTDSNGLGPDRQLSASVSLGVPIYSGGAVRNSIRAAETRVGAGQADLRGTESAVFSQVVAAYMDVILGQAVVGLYRNNVQVLEVNLRATSDRFEIGDLTRTDVAQSQARLALSRSDARSSEANLIAARERYIQLVGKPPVDLSAPPPLPGLPATAEEAVTVALENNPDIIAARERSRAADFDINVAGSTRMPRVEVFTGGSYTDYYGTLGGTSSGAFAQSSTGATAGVRATIPIFQGGRPAALQRQAQARASATMEAEIGTEREVIAQVRAAYSSWRAASEIIDSTQSAVDAATLSLEGVRAENSVGNRTILNILDAEQELLRASTQLVTARRNAYVAGFSLLAAMGKAEAQDLGLEGGPLYDPNTNYQRVKDLWSDWSSDPAPAAISTRTVDTPAQDGSIPKQ
jgi:outer membrane protein